MAVLLTVTACTTMRLPSLGTGGKAMPLEADEQELWQTATQLEQRLAHSGILYEDVALETYLTQVAQTLLPSDARAVIPSPRIKVVHHPFLNAFALPHGVIYIHTGMLAQMENEAQVATVLGHELAHFIHRHTVKEIRQAQNQLAFYKALGVALAVVSGSLGATIGGLTDEAGRLWALASVRGYSRALEREADAEGLSAMVTAGYDPKEAPKVFAHLQRESQGPTRQEPFFFGTHPRLQERLDNYHQLLTTQSAAQVDTEGLLTHEEEFLTHIAPLLLDNAALDLSLGRLATAQAAIQKHLQRQPHSARAYFLFGQVYERYEPQDASAPQAIAAYQEAVRLDPTYAAPQRTLGLLYRAQHRPAQARAAFVRYLALHPDAVDAPIIQGYVDELQTP
jgi:predicted Zn-dependent protease